MQANLGPQAQGLVQKLAAASRYLQAAAFHINKAGPQINQQVLAEVIRNLQWFVQSGNNALKPTTTKKAGRASATLANLRKAQRIACQINRVCGSQDWYIGVRVVNDRRGIALGIGAATEPPRRLRGSLEGIPVVLEGPGGRMVRVRQEGNRRLRLALRMVAAEVAEELGETGRVALKGPMTTPLDHPEEMLLQEIENYPAGVPIQDIEDKKLLRSLINKGYLEVYPGNKVRSLGRAARRLAADGLGIDPEEEKALKHHQRLVKRVYNHIKNSKRLSGSVRYLARKLGINFNDLVRVIGQLIVEGKIEMTKKKKFKLLPEPHTPVPGMKDRFSATNSVFGIDRGRSDKRVDQLLSQSNYQLNMNEDVDGTKYMRDIRERPSKIMPDPTSPN